MARLERIVAVVLFAAAATSHSAPNPRCDSWSARLVSAQGVVQVQYPGTADWHATELHQTFCLGDRLRTRDDSRAAFELRNDTLLRLDQNTTLLLPEAASEDNFWVDLLDGALHLLSRVKRSLEIRTPFVNAGLETYDGAKLPMFMAGNVFLSGAKPSKHEPRPLVQAVHVLSDDGHGRKQ